MPLYDRILSVFARLARDRRASIAPTFALLLLPLLGTMGMAIDVSSMLAERTRMQNIADAAAINYAVAMQSRLETCGTTTACVNDANYVAQTSNATFFNGLTGDDKSLASAGAFGGSNGTYNSTSGTISVHINATFSYQTSFMGLFGISSVNLSVSSFATQAVAKYMQVIFVIDVSESMGVGATATDVSNLENDADITAGSGGGSCAFACHTNSTISGDGATDNRAVARQKGYTLKIDSVQQAVQDFVTQLSALNQSAPNHYNVGVYTFSNVLHNVLSPTTNFTAINTAISPTQTDAIDLDLGSGVEPCWNNCQGWTYLTSALQSVNGALTNVGDGSSPTSLLTYVILLTDGVEDTYNTSAWAGHQTDTTWSTQCSAIKNSGATMATVQAVYVSTTTSDNQAYTDLVAPIASSLPTAFSSCASSSDLALTATDGPGIENAVQELFTKFATSPRLTQ